MTWYYARVRWAVMVEGQGLREWKESAFMIRAVGRKAAFERALELGRRSQQWEGERRGWVENRLAEIVELDGLWDGQEIELGVMEADGTIGFEHQFEPERSEPQTAF